MRSIRLPIIAALLMMFTAHAQARVLRVCADPNNLPFSNERGEGFENKIAQVIADELNATLSYTWWAQRRGFLRKTLNDDQCDLVTGTTNGIEMLRTTRPYYRSGFMFVSRRGGPAVTSLDDPVLHDLKIGIQLVGEDGSNPPPSEALARRGVIDNVKGYMVYGDYRDEAPASNIMKAVAAGEIDVAIVWGPLAGYFATREDVPLVLTFVKPEIDGPRLPMAFDANMGVRRTDRALLDEINRALVNRKSEIDAILADYGVPRLDKPAAPSPMPATAAPAP